jgi:hypothetical protein
MCSNSNPDFSLLNINWICGFINADGGFLVTIVNSLKIKLGFTYYIRIAITQNNISLLTLQKIKEYL